MLIIRSRVFFCCSSHLFIWN